MFPGETGRLPGEGVWPIMRLAGPRRPERDGTTKTVLALEIVPCTSDLGC